MRRKVIAQKSSGRRKSEKAKEPSMEEEEEESHTSPPPSSPKRTTPHASQKSSQKTKEFMLHETREPTNLSSMEFKNKFHKPHSHFDPSRFSTCAFYEFHKEVLEKRHLCPSYLVNLESLASKGINLQPLFDGLKWSPLLLIHKMVYPGLVRQFYANLRHIDGSLHSYVKRVHITLNTETIASALGYIDEGPKVYMSDKWDSHVGVAYKQVLHQICENLSGLDGTVPTHKALGPTNSLLHRIITHILTPQSGSHNRVTVSDCLIIFALITSSSISFSYLMIRHMWESVKSTKKANLPYGMFLTCIFEYFKVDLTNEDVENKVSMIKGGGATKKGKKSMAFNDDFESRLESSKATDSLRDILTEFSNMSDLMVQFHKSARKLAYENESAWKKCQERVGLMLESLDDEAGGEAGAEGSDFNLSDD
ncbi:uncharacterized protein LOC107615110 [Arachis ipaensis]|uniref:uncharacterized protein LOC107615110 n=1 Tax=Arachis ipaensis TaxID=130454 RepID=UPI0007AF0881|nr:uncharacterized protein LOC107615110 [Arachis ipaensis]